MQDATSCLEDHISHDAVLCRAPTLLQLLHADCFSPYLPAGGARETEDTDSRPGGSGPSGQARPKVSLLTHTHSLPSGGSKPFHISLDVIAALYK